MHSRFHRASVLACLALAVAVLPGCAGTSTGKKMDEEMKSQGAVYNNPQLQAYVNRVGQRLVAHSDEPDTTFTFTVIDSPDINAFALPGGYIYINRGLLPYLESEAELAGVLAHEIGHVTAGHHTRQQTAAVTNKVVATTAYILTGSGELASASDMYGTELVSGYGRDMELEADGLGAKFMYQAGYDPDALLEVIGALKNQEQYQRVKAKAGGKSPSSYHGLYATHPRNDQRLQQVVKTASELDRSTQLDDPSVAGEFQRELEGLVWGESVQSERAANRYYHNKLAFTVELPPQWTVNAGAKAIVATAPDGNADLTITLRRREQGATPRSMLESSTGQALVTGTELDQAGLKGYTAVTGSGNASRRVAIINYDNLTYLFTGQAKDFANGDPQLMSLIQSFRPMHPAEFRDGSGYYIHFIQVPRGATMASIAAGVPITDAETQLRLLNGLYPSGEPRAGDWIKTIR
jgi:predicted Zn-dependent protease